MFLTGSLPPPAPSVAESAWLLWEAAGTINSAVWKAGRGGKGAEEWSSRALKRCAERFYPLSIYGFKMRFRKVLVEQRYTRDT